MRHHYRLFMKTFFVLVAAVILVGCAPPRTQQEMTEFVSNNTQVVVYDHCEYLFTQTGAGNNYAMSLTHKGNCSNPVHNK